MSDIILYGDARSTFVRSTRMACVEKGVAHRLEPVELSSASYRDFHPFAKMPAMDHGDFRLFEACAIMRYVDENFDGPALQPAHVKGRALMAQWISVHNDYLAKDIGRRFLLQYFIPKGPDGAPDQAVIDAALPDVRHRLSVLDGALADTIYFVGDDVSLADLAIIPILSYVDKVPPGPDLLAACPNIRRWIATMTARQSFTETIYRPASDEAAE